jgi:hypothetical protein
VCADTGPDADVARIDRLRYRSDRTLVEIPRLAWAKEPAMADEPLIPTTDGDSARITLNRPDVHDALSIELSENQQACRQLELLINRGSKTDLYTAQGFEMLSAA